MFRSLLVLPTLFASSLALVFAVDSSTLALSQNFTRAIIRGYGPGCSVGGQVDPNFLSSYNNARAAGFNDFDIYWPPCNGSTYNCTSHANQLSEISAILSAQSIKIGTFWIEIEREFVGCLGWDYGSGNIAQAQQLIAAVKATDFNFGIFSGSGTWTNIFGSINFVLDNTAPLWFTSFTNTPTIAFGAPFGGWTTAVGQQYADVAPAEDGGLVFDLNVSLASVTRTVPGYMCHTFSN
ncbi:glycoside hydrolase family 25 protein [Sphaerobolus stellatus SS14]|uniref:Glycoside hydrolase family 25 protein n=1 Tax=Sphaerobolus stellatus (strain SS14) TaxID=990650 RepID=A0A0C9V0D1_SPHS4|nr:glycoside hydrolase family 25 protein [Sphaerobolus stellatus SS14]